MFHARRLLAFVLAAAALPAAAAEAAPQFTAPLVATGTTTDRCTDLTPAAAGRSGIASARIRPLATGVATVGVAAGSGDWDLVAFDAATGRKAAAVASSSGREWGYASATSGRELLVLGCRRPGASRTAEARVAVHAVDVTKVERNVASLVEVDLTDTRTLEDLEATGLDVTHNHVGDHVDVVLYGAADAAKLTAAGFKYRTRIADLRAQDDATLLADERAAQTSGASLLPSGRTTYRALADYDADLKSIADDPALAGIARGVSIGRTLEDRSIDAIELATDVTATDDGRPTFLVMGVHHAREWPSGEMPMEFALDIAKRFKAGDARVRALLTQVRILAVPVLNRDGFTVSRAAGPLGPFDDSAAPLPLSLTDAAAYKRKNCRALVAQAQATPCITRPAIQGVDPNRNYGAFYGGTGSSTDPTSQGFRGPGPYSEPETEAIHRLSSTRSIPVLVTHHTFTAGGTWLRQPGFCQASGCDSEVDVVEDEAPMAALGDAMGQATGWASQLGWAIGQITGATEDWNYFTQGTLGYTPEQRAVNFHPSYATAVVREYDGTGPGAKGGVGEALLRAAETAANPASHAVVTGRATAGRTLRLKKSFATPTSLAGVVVDDTLDFTTVVPADGTFEWAVNQSSRPGCDGLRNCTVTAGTKESYMLTCEAPTGAVLASRSVTIDRGQRLDLGTTC